MKNDNFKFFIPADIEKASDSSGKEVMRFRGVASDNREDTQGEFLDPSGFDTSSFRFVNWNHLGSKDAATIIGEPTKSFVNEKNQFIVEGVLFPEVAMAKSAWALMKALQNSPNGNKLGISVEGKAMQRGSEDKKNPLYNRITKARITSIALCPVPINGGTWADIMKGEMPYEEDEEYDDDTKKAMTAEGGDNVTSKEDVEGEKNKKKIPVTIDGPLKKSDIFAKIYDNSPSITIEKAKSVYSLIEKIANMNTEKEIKDETISKAFEILDLASDSISKAAKEEAVKKEELEEDDEDEKEMVKKASHSYKVMKAEGKDKEAVKVALIKKGYGEKVIEKAMKEDVEEKEEKKEGLSKSEVSEILKAQTDSLVKSFDEKFKAMGTILKSVTEESDEIKKSLSVSLGENKDLKCQLDELNTILKTPVNQKSIISKSFSPRFGSEGEGEAVKSGRKFNISTPIDRMALRDVVTELSGINKGDGNFDIGLTKIATELEVTKSLSAGSLNRLKAMEFEIVNG